MSTVKLTVVAAKVAGSETNVPLLITPSLITGLGTLSSANANSARLYSDVTKLVEQPREIYTADEIYTKVAALTTLSEVYFDYDGIRADYSVSATYGRNNVWTAYTLVMHLADTTNSTGGSTPTTTGTVTFGSSYGKIKDGSDTSGTGTDYISTGVSLPTGNTAKTIQCWFNWDTPTTNRGWLIAGGTDANDQAFGFFVQSVSGLYFHGNGGSADYTFSYSPAADTWYMIHSSYDGAGLNSFYSNGASNGTKSRNLNTGSSTVKLHLRQNEETGSRYDGSLDEVRIKNSTTPATWITTEYNNQNDNGAFWTATAGGGPVQNSNFLAFMS